MESEFIALTKEGLELYNTSLNEKGDELKVEKIRSIETVEAAEWSPAGNVVALVKRSSPTKLFLMDASTWEVQHTIDGETSITKFSFSPLGRFLLLHRRLSSSSSNNNLFVYSTETANQLICMHKRSISESSWPPLKWTNNERFIFRMVSGGIHVYLGSELGSPTFNINNPTYRISSPLATSFFPSPERVKETDGRGGQLGEEGVSACIAIFSRECKGSPSCVEVYTLSEESPPSSASKKSFFQVQEVECLWSYDGKALLIKTQNEASDMTYYGSSALHFLRLQNLYEVRLVAVEDGPVHAALWSPSSLEFAVCYGKVPAKAALYDGSSKLSSPKLMLGEGMKLSLSYCPFSRLLLWGGFGNLAGQLDVWNTRKKGLLGKTISPSAICEWSTSGCYFITANISPRLRVDNRISFFSLSGALLHRLEFGCLYTVSFRPLTPIQFKKSYESQLELINSLNVYKSTDIPLASGAETISSIGSFKCTGRSISQIQNDTAGGCYKPPALRSNANRLPPGVAEPPAPTAGKKSERKKKKKKNPSDTDKIESGEKGGGGEEDARSETKENEAKIEQKCNDGDAMRKMIRSIKKKLNEIERLKEKTDLNEVQKVKINNEENLRNELSRLEAQFSSAKENVSVSAQFLTTKQKMFELNNLEAYSKLWQADVDTHIYLYA